MAQCPSPSIVDACSRSCVFCLSIYYSSSGHEKVPPALMTDGTEFLVDMAGFQPATSRMRTERSSRLSYMPVCGGSWGDDGSYCVHRPGCLVLGCGLVWCVRRFNHIPGYAAPCQGTFLIFPVSTKSTYLYISLVSGDALDKTCPLGNPALHVAAALDVTRRFLDSVVSVDFELDD